MISEKLWTSLVKEYTADYQITVFSGIYSKNNCSKLPLDVTEIEQRPYKKEGLPRFSSVMLDIANEISMEKPRDKELKR